MNKNKGKDKNLEKKVWMTTKYHVWQKVKFIHDQELHDKLTKEVASLKQFRATVNQALRVKQSCVATKMKEAVFGEIVLLLCFVLFKIGDLCLT